MSYAELQKEAIQWTDRNVMEAPLWMYPQSIVNKLGFDYADEIQNRQRTVLALMLAPGAVMNIHAVSMESTGTYTAEAFLSDVFDIVWKPLASQDNMQSYFRRQLQRSYVDLLGSALNPSQEKDKGSAYKNLLLRIKKIREKYESGK